MKFSLVIPLAPGRNAEIVDSIKELNYPKKEYEVIIREGLNPSENRNNGAKVAKGEIIAFLDDDAVVDINFLKDAEEFFKKYKEIDIVGGAQLTPKWQKGFPKIAGYALSSKFGAWKMGTRYSLRELNLDADETMLTSANLFCRKEVMKKIQFDPKLFPGEDPKFVEDAKKAGFKVAYSPNLILYHKRRETVRAMIKQISSYGRTRTDKESFANTLKKPFFLIPLLFCVYLSLTLLFIFLELFNLQIISNFILFFPLGLYLVLDLFFTFYESIKNKNALAIFLLPFIFPLIHISYGIGMIQGYLQKKKKI
jgi:succinoglycan biosynthesis protein ExoA